MTKQTIVKQTSPSKQAKLPSLESVTSRFRPVGQTLKTQQGNVRDTSEGKRSKHLLSAQEQLQRESIQRLTRDLDQSEKPFTLFGLPANVTAIDSGAERQTKQVRDATLGQLPVMLHKPTALRVGPMKLTGGGDHQLTKFSETVARLKRGTQSLQQPQSGPNPQYHMHGAGLNLMDQQPSVWDALPGWPSLNLPIPNYMSPAMTDQTPNMAHQNQANFDPLRLKIKNQQNELKLRTQQNPYSTETSPQLAYHQPNMSLEQRLRDTNQLQDEEAKRGSLFTCKRCSKQFKTRQGLGGHASKTHPGESQNYIQKLHRRNQRKNERLVLSVAKSMLLQDEDDVIRLGFMKRKKRKPRHVPAGDGRLPQNYENGDLNKGDFAQEAGNRAAQPKKKMSEQERGRIRRLKYRIWEHIEKPNQMRMRLIFDEDMAQQIKKAIKKQNQAAKSLLHR